MTCADRRTGGNWTMRGSLAVVLLTTLLLPGAARAGCQFSPFAFFPDRNDTVDVDVHVTAGSTCVMGFREGPGYHFTSADFVSGPSLGILAQTGATQFTYYTLRERKGSDSYAIKICAVVHGHKGCSILRYNAEVE